MLAEFVLEQTDDYEADGDFVNQDGLWKKVIGFIL